VEFADSMSGAIRNVQCLVNQTARQYPGPESWSRGILPIDGVAHLLLARIWISQSHVERQGSLVPLIHDVLLGVAYHNFLGFRYRNRIGEATILGYSSSMTLVAKIPQIKGQEYNG